MRAFLTMDNTKRDWRFFLDEWGSYKKATGFVDPGLDELWSCMAPDLKHLAFDQGGKGDLTTKKVMLAMIRSLAVTKLHTAIHIVNLHDAKQTVEASTNAFAARIRGIAANCNLSKACTKAKCDTKVSFVDETIFNIILFGLRDHKMQERVLAAAYMTTVNTVPELVTFYSADKSIRNQGSATVVGIRMSNYQREKKPGEIRLSGSELPTAGAPGSQGCKGCGGKCRSSKDCWAYTIACRTCGIKGHVAKVYQSKNKSTTVGMQCHHCRTR